LEHFTLGQNDKTVMDSTLNPSASGTRHWLRVLRPIGWWLILVLVLFVIRTHQRLCERTKIAFTVTLDGRELSFMNDATATFDGRAVESGQIIPLGQHMFTVSHPKAEPFSTNLFVWYGEHNYGQINLKRAKGPLEVHVNPPADLLVIRGPEFQVILTNSRGMTSSVPTDNYSVEADYLHSRETRQITVTPNLSGQVRINARFGTVQMVCNQSNALFQVLKPDGNLLEAGEFPATLRDVPEGDYTVAAWHHQNRQEKRLSVKTDITNDATIQFIYGTALIESEPSGASVTSADGHLRGYTPLQLVELPVGHWQFKLTQDGYEPKALSLEIQTGQTSTIRTNLVSINYGRALKVARDYLAAADYERALEAANAALQAKHGDPEALIVQKEALGMGRLRRAEAFGKQGDYIAGIKELELAVQALPDNEEIKQLLGDFKKREPEQIERLRVERLERPRKIFNSLTAPHSDFSLFDEHELKTTKPAKEVETAIVSALKDQPAFRVMRNDSPAPDTFEIEATQELSTFLNTSAGRRTCLIVGGQTRDDETVILFKVLEYKTEAVNKFSIGNLIGTPVEVNYVPIHASGNAKLSDKLQAQLNAGMSNVTERIQQAIGP
jgi:hypothetical protein